MYQNKYRQFSRNSFSRGNSNVRSRNNRRGNGRNNSLNDHTLYIRKAVEIQEIPEYKPAYTYAELPINEVLKNNILRKGFSSPTPIQDLAIPSILDGNDFIGMANTGTGKTAAYLIPLIEKISKNNQERILIIAPTRELANQINSEFISLKQGLNLYSAVLIGGAPMGQQIRELRRNPNLLIVTPGRLGDHIGRGFINFSKFKYVVLDEVDRMLDMGFVKEIKKILGQLPESRQSLFFSATLSNQVEELIRENSKNPVKANVVTGKTSDHVDQDIVKVGRSENKIEILHELLIKDNFTKTLIFGKTKIGVQKLHKELNERGFKVESLHGDKTQYARQRSLLKFKEGHVNILIATDVAARGLDIADISHVINFDLPDSYDDYIHRIGRTGRANKIGQALTFVSSGY